MGLTPMTSSHNGAIVTNAIFLFLAVLSGSWAPASSQQVSKPEATLSVAQDDARLAKLPVPLREKGRLILAEPDEDKRADLAESPSIRTSFPRRSCNGSTPNWRSRATWKIVYGHHPIYSEGQHEDNNDKVEQLLPVLRDRADVYFAGHDHDMQHLRPEGRLHFFVAGSAGKLRTIEPGPRSLFAKGAVGSPRSPQTQTHCPSSSSRKT